MTLEGVERALELVDLGEVQNACSVLDRTHEDIVEFCREREIAFVPLFPLGSAFTGGPQKLAGDSAVSSVANKHGVTPSQVALAWLLARYDRRLLISGTTSVAHLEENLAAGGLELDDQDMAVLDVSSRTCASRTDLQDRAAGRPAAPALATCRALAPQTHPRTAL